MITSNWQNTLDWLLEPSDIGVRYLALRDLVICAEKELEEARKKAHAEGPIAAVLEKMNPDGYWEKPGVEYYPKYTGSVWSVVLLAQLGGDVKTDERVEKACSYLLDHDLTGGRFTTNGLPSGTMDCMQGNLCWAMTIMGCKSERLDKAFEWMAKSVTGEGIAPLGGKRAVDRYYAGKCGPNFACGANNKLPCAWGAVKVMLAFSALPAEMRTPQIDRAINAGVDFLFSKDPAMADYPSSYAPKPSGNWWKFGFPVFYVTDILQIAEALVGLGYAGDPRLANAIKLIRDKQDTDGRWSLEYDYSGKTWLDSGAKKQPNKWVTLRATRVLQKVKS